MFAFFASADELQARGTSQSLRYVNLLGAILERQTTSSQLHSSCPSAKLAPNEDGDISAHGVNLNSRIATTLTAGSYRAKATLYRTKQQDPSTLRIRAQEIFTPTPTDGMD